MILIAILAITGCNHAFGPEQMETTTITGRVHARDRPIGKGWIEFMPAGGTIGKFRSAALRPDGSFTATKVPVGSVSLRLPGPPGPLTGDPALDGYLVHVNRRPFKLLNVRRGENPPLDLDLYRELLEETRRVSSRLESGR